MRTEEENRIAEGVIKILLKILFSNFISIRFCTGGDQGFEGIRKSDIIKAYLEQIGNQLESEEELIEKKNLIAKIIERLVYIVSNNYL